MEGIVPDEDVVTTLSEGNGAFTFPAVPSGAVSAVHRNARAPTSQLSSEPVGWVNVPLDVGATDIDGSPCRCSARFGSMGGSKFEGTAERPAASELEKIQVTIEAADGQQARVPAFPARRGQRHLHVDRTSLRQSYLVRVVHSPPGWMFKSAMVDGRDVSETPLDLQGRHQRPRDPLHRSLERAERHRPLHSGDGDSEATVVIFPADAEKWTNYGRTPRRVRSARTSKTGE
jgi:hypothetical protein